jgi:hypothetical protein
MTLIANPSDCSLGLANFFVVFQNFLNYMHSKRGSVDDKGE